MLKARPYAFLDDAPLEERRTQAVMARRWLAPEQASTSARSTPRRSRGSGEAWPDAASADELHDALVWLGFLTEGEVQAGPAGATWSASCRAKARRPREVAGATLWVAAERLPRLRAL